jgi:predicted Rossmann-fold nucleotide-binding protein
MRRKDFYKALRKALRKAQRLGRNRDERRVLLYGRGGHGGLMRRAFEGMKRKPRHKRRDRRKGC